MNLCLQTVDRRGFANARDVAEIGAWGSADARTLRPGVVYRSEAPLEHDPPPFQPWPPELVVDLRSPSERHGPHPLRNASRIEMIPFYGGGDPRTIARSTDSLGEVYALMLDTAAAQLVRIAELVAESDGPVLLHCAAGKDRTGIAVAVLLASAGVPDALVLADYVRTGDNMAALLERMVLAQPGEGRARYRASLAAVPGDLLAAPAAAITGVLTDLAAHAGGAGGWLLARGLDHEVLTTLRSRLVTDAT